MASDLLSGGTRPGFAGDLLTPDADMAKRVGEAIERQLADLPRADTARRALSASRLIVARDLDQCIAISNQYGPEHLIIQTRNARDLGSTASPVQVWFSRRLVPGVRGDFASGHQPRSADVWLHLDLFQPGSGRFPETHGVQELSREGFASLASTIETLAAAERLYRPQKRQNLRCALQP